jgi:hypothetical protein
MTLSVSMLSHCSHEMHADAMSGQLRMTHQAQILHGAASEPVTGRRFVFRSKLQ